MGTRLKADAGTGEDRALAQTLGIELDLVVAELSGQGDEEGRIVGAVRPPFVVNADASHKCALLGW